MYNKHNVKSGNVKARCNIVVMEINRKSTLKSKTLDALNKVKFLQVHQKNEQTKYQLKILKWQNSQ